MLTLLWLPGACCASILSIDYSTVDLQIVRSVPHRSMKRNKNGSGATVANSCDGSVGKLSLGSRSGRRSTSKTKSTAGESTCSLEEGSMLLQSRESHVILLEDTIDGLTNALTEVQAELRDQTARSEVLKNTVVAVSRALKIAEEGRYKAELETERLSLQVSSLSFVELRLSEDPSETSSDVDVVELGEKPTKESREKNSSKKGKRVTKKKTKRAKKTPSPKRKREANVDAVVGYRDPLSDEDNLFSDFDHIEEGADAWYQKTVDIMGEAGNQEGDVVEAEEVSERRVWEGVGQCQDHAVSPRTPAPALGEANSEQDSPSQAAFYHVLRERDVAQAQARKLQSDLAKRDALVQDLRQRLSKSVALVELSYNDGKSKKARELKFSRSMPGARPRADVDAKRKWFNGKASGNQVIGSSSTDYEVTPKSRADHATGTGSRTVVTADCVSPRTLGARTDCLSPRNSGARVERVQI